jgi:NADH:ubiquinone oxidoreductase subunit H
VHIATLPALSGLLLLIACVLLLFLERKAIGLAQKRLGISFLGRNGWAHLPADLLKFWLKYTAKHQGGWLGATSGLSGLALAYLAWNLAGLIFLPLDRVGAVGDL